MLLKGNFSFGWKDVINVLINSRGLLKYLIVENYRLSVEYMIKKVWVDFIMEIRPFVKFSLGAKFQYNPRRLFRLIIDDFFIRVF